MNRPPNKAPCMHVAVRFLAGRAHSEAELGRKLRLKGYDQAEIDRVNDELRRRGYLDDAALCRDLCEKLTAGGKYGKQGIIHQLERRGLPAAVIAATAGDDDCDAEYRRALSVASKRFKAPQPEDAPKIGCFLAGRGFAADIIFKVLEGICKFDSL